MPCSENEELFYRSHNISFVRKHREFGKISYRPDWEEQNGFSSFNDRVASKIKHCEY